MIEQAREHGEDLTIAAVGPPTNLALAVATEPELPELVSDIYLIGGALKTTGNVTPQASFNFYVDPPAAARVIQDASPKVVGIDVTERVYVPTAEIERLAEAPHPLSTISELFAFSIEEVRRKFDNDGGLASDAVVISDIAAHSLTLEDAYAEIDTTGGLSDGATIYDEHESPEEVPNCEVALQADGEVYQNVVISNLETYK